MSSTEGLEVVQKYLQLLGVEPEATTVYLGLTRLGPASALQLAKATKISRTQIYRHLEALEAKNLVSAEQLSYGTLFRVLPLDNLEALLAERESVTAAMKRDLGAMAGLMQQLAGASGPQATARHYYGPAGLKQVNWNLTKAEHEFRVFETAHLTQLLDKTFARRCRERYVERQLTSYDLTNATAVNAADLEPFQADRSLFRHIDPELLRIDFELYIYNDVVALIDYGQEQQLALEIYHPTLKTMMQQLFDAMWAQGTPLAIQKQRS